MNKYTIENQRLRTAIRKAVRGILAEIADPMQGTSETLGHIEERVRELAEAIPAEPTAREEAV